MKVIGITGGIASGKSLVTKALIDGGYYVIDTDIIAHELLKDSNVIGELIRTFGEQVYADGAINRKVLGAIIFEDKNKQKKLNNIIHPLVIKEVERLLSLTNRKIVFVDVPLLFESGMDELMDAVIVVAVNPKTQLERLCKRDNISKEYAKKKINMQMPLTEKMKLADYIIDNNESIEDTLNQLEAILRRLKNEI